MVPAHRPQYTTADTPDARTIGERLGELYQTATADLELPASLKAMGPLLRELVPLVAAHAGSAAGTEATSE